MILVDSGLDLNEPMITARFPVQGDNVLKLLLPVMTT
jgi:hypothetical protein